MSDNKAVAAKASTTPAQRQTQPPVQPPVDVFEDDTGITLTVDLPGVAGKGLNLQVDNDTLLIEGEAALDMPEDIQPLYAEIRSIRYRRSFALSSELDTGAIDADLKDGVLTVTLPKHKEHQPRKIEVKAS